MLGIKAKIWEKEGTTKKIDGFPYKPVINPIKLLSFNPRDLPVPSPPPCPSRSLRNQTGSSCSPARGHPQHSRPGFPWRFSLPGAKPFSDSCPVIKSGSWEGLERQGITQPSVFPSYLQPGISFPQNCSSCDIPSSWNLFCHQNKNPLSGLSPSQFVIPAPERHVINLRRTKRTNPKIPARNSRLMGEFLGIKILGCPSDTCSCQSVAVLSPGWTHTRPDPAFFLGKPQWNEVLEQREGVKIPAGSGFPAHQQLENPNPSHSREFWDGSVLSLNPEGRNPSPRF